MVLCDDGHLYAWGNNDHGQLGLGNEDNHSTPQRVLLPGDARVVGLACGYSHSMVLCDDGHLYSWGWNDRGQLGLGHTTDQSSPQQVIQLPNDLDVVGFACGGFHSLVMFSNGGLYSWGWNEIGQLGLGYNKGNLLTPQHIVLMGDLHVVDIACGWIHSMVLCRNGDIYTWGMNDKCQLGLGHNSDASSPQHVTNLSTNLHWWIGEHPDELFDEHFLFMKKLREDKQFTDVKVGGIPVHSSIIKVCCPDHLITRVDHSDSLTLNILLDIIYTGRFQKSIIAPLQLVKLLCLSKQLKIKHVVSLCQRTLMSSAA